MRRMLRGILAGVLALVVLFAACAKTVPVEESSEAGNAPVSDPIQSFSAGESTETGEPSVSEPTQSLPAEESGVDDFSEPENSGSESGTEPSDPDPWIPPEESETKLELVTTFQTGEDGLFPYFFYWGEAGSERILYRTINGACADEKGNLYVLLPSFGYEITVCRLNDGRMYECDVMVDTYSILYCNGFLYLPFYNYWVLMIDVETGACGAIMPPADLADEISGEFRLVAFGGEEPVWMHHNGKECYSLHGKKLSDEEYLQKSMVTTDPAGKGTLTQSGGGFPLTLDGDTAGCWWSVLYEDAETLLCEASRGNRVEDQPYNVVWERVYCRYDRNGHAVSRFLETMIRYEEQPCSLPFTSHGQAYTLESYDSYTILIGDRVFGDVFDYSMIAGADGTLYLLLFYFDRGGVYRILPGYENATFSDRTKG